MLVPRFRVCPITSRSRSRDRGSISDLAAHFILCVPPAAKSAVDELGDHAGMLDIPKLSIQAAMSTRDAAWLSGHVIRNDVKVQDPCKAAWQSRHNHSSRFGKHFPSFPSTGKSHRPTRFLRGREADVTWSDVSP
ncbi:hypothetical protein Hypma_004768 [Hypsizygus marmoreus]|uniref:Uncharacterized protein n=1 Tax=Hypsizygus marmoreus TaxID=39966 RepID=A0A369IZS8_HYPMA|nr:hypothetical protein Hypma_004768 [Hypsizygus marmoreus]